MTYAEKQKEAARRIQMRVDTYTDAMSKAADRLSALELILAMLSSSVFKLPEEMLDKVLTMYDEEGNCDETTEG
jgi:hypothetical protein